MILSMRLTGGFEMKVLLIGGTGVISTAVSALAVQAGMELTALNRGNRSVDVPAGARVLQGDMEDEAAIRRLLQNERFDVAANFINFTRPQVERDIRLFSGRVGQYIFISSASAYQKPMSNYLVTESTPLANPYWQYSRDKIACENCLMDAYRQSGFPVTIVRPSHTYSRRVPVAIHGEKGSWQVVKRMLEGKPVVVHGDGLSLWTLTHSTDFAKGFIGLIGNVHAIGEAVHITSDETLCWNTIYRIIAGALGVEYRPVYLPSTVLARWNPALEGGLLGDKANSVVFDNTKLKRLVPGFAATVRFDQGARMALDYMLSHPDEQVEDPAFDLWCDRMVERYRRAFEE